MTTQQPERGASAAVCERQLSLLRDTFGQEPRLGCSLVAHRDLGFCQCCPGIDDDHAAELTGWRLLAMAERGIPLQPFEKGLTHD